MHDDNTPCISAEQTAWIDLVNALRSHIVKCTDKKSKISLNMLGGLVELTSFAMQLHILASSFDEACESNKAKHKRRIRSYDIG